MTWYEDRGRRGVAACLSAFALAAGLFSASVSAAYAGEPAGEATVTTVEAAGDEGASDAPTAEVVLVEEVGESSAGQDGDSAEEPAGDGGEPGVADDESVASGSSDGSADLEAPSEGVADDQGEPESDETLVAAVATASEDAALAEPVDSEAADAVSEAADAVAESSSDVSADDASSGANSWRFQDGQLVRIPDETSDDGIAVMSLWPAWSKVGNFYVNSVCEVIPNAVSRGIDVSFWDETIDWDAVVSDDVDFAILRCGYRGSVSRSLYTDTQWSRNVSECERLGLKYGVYFYSTATTADEARQEAQYVLGLLAGHTPGMPVYYDLEDSMIQDCDLASIATAFCTTIEAAGYRAGVYANTWWWNTFLTDPVFEQWDRWVAQYNVACYYEGSYSIWQATSTGSVAGVSTNVDINFIIDQSGSSSTDTSPSDGWFASGDEIYYYEGGSPVTGEKEVEGDWYYFDPSNGGAMARSELVYLDGAYLDGGAKTVYYGSDGRMAHGEAYADGAWRYFDPSTGAMARSEFVYLDGAYLDGGPKTVYYGEGGAMWYGEVCVDGSWYYLDASTGARATGLVTLTDELAGKRLDGGAKTVFYGSDGRMAHGEAYADGAWRYFDPSTGAMARSTFVRLTGTYLDGGAKTVYYDGDGRMVYGQQTIGGVSYYFDQSTGAMR